MVNCIFGSLLKGPDKHFVQGPKCPKIACVGPARNAKNIFEHFELNII